MIDRLTEINAQLPTAVAVVGLLLLVLVVDFIAKRIILSAVRAFAKHTPVSWDDVLVEHRVFERLVHMASAVIVFVGVAFLPDLPEGLVQLVRNISLGYMVLMLTLALTSALSAANAIYEKTPAARDRPIKGFVQLLQIVVWVFGLVLIIAAVLDRSPLLLLSGFGAMTAILLLIFKDTILSLVASVQLTAQDMVRVGDWIEMPQFGADGDVIDVQLHTVKVQNWDKTITTIPTHRLISDSFKNWRGMSETGARRIKRALHLDVSSIRFQTEEEIAHFTRFALLKDYIVEKKQELNDYNQGLDVKVDAAVNQRRLTNIGTLRAYAFNYLKNHPEINANMTLIVRQLSPSAEGLPLEVYCFTSTTAWDEYERIQSDVFDHLLAIVPEFGLRLFQSPAGSDIKDLRAPAAMEQVGD